MTRVRKVVSRSCTMMRGPVMVMRGMRGKQTEPSARAETVTSLVEGLISSPPSSSPRGQLVKEFKELRLNIARKNGLEVADVRLGVVEVLKELQAVGQTRKDGELPLERVLAEVKVKRGYVVNFPRLPVGVGLEANFTTLFKTKRQIYTREDNCAGPTMVIW